MSISATRFWQWDEKVLTHDVLGSLLKANTRVTGFSVVFQIAPTSEEVEIVQVLRGRP